LKVGVLEDGSSRSVKGDGQGSVISPLLRNVYCKKNYVFDLWSERWRRASTGGMMIVRYAH